MRVAEEIIQSEKNAAGLHEPDPALPRQRGNSSQHASPTEENNNKTVVSLASDLGRSVLTNQSDLNKSVSSGYGTTTSMTSSAVDDNDSEMTGSSLSQPDPPPQQDEFALYLPPLGDDSSGSYREEVSISLSSTPGNKTNRARPSGASSASSSTLTNSSSPSSSRSSSVSGRAPETQNSTSSAASSSTRDSAASAHSSRKQPASSPLKVEVEVPKDEPDSRLTVPDVPTGSGDDGDLVLNFGPKEISSTAYGRDYELPSRQRAVEAEGSERKRWSVTLDPYSSAADVVNRQPSLEETEEKVGALSVSMYVSASAGWLDWQSP